MPWRRVFAGTALAVGVIVAASSYVGAWNFAVNDVPAFVGVVIANPLWVSAALFLAAIVSLWWEPWLRGIVHPAHLVVSLTTIRDLEGCHVECSAHVFNSSHKNYGKEILAVVENIRHNGRALASMPSQIPLRTEGAIRDVPPRHGRFHLSGGIGKNVPILWRKAAQGALHFRHENGKEYPVPFRSLEFDLAVVGANVPVRKTIRVQIVGSKVTSELV